MRYLCLIYDDEAKINEMSKDEGDAFMGEYFAFTDGIRQGGQYVAGEALHPVATATTVRIRNGKLSTTDGPFAETRELVAGFWLWQLRSLDEAIEWARRCPNPFEHGESELEIRQVFEVEDFGDEFTPELRDREARLRAQVATQE